MRKINERRTNKWRSKVITTGLVALMASSLIPASQAFADTVPTTDLPTLTASQTSPNVKLKVVPGARVGDIQGVKIGEMTAPVSINTSASGAANTGEVKIGAGQLISPTGAVITLTGGTGMAEISTQWEDVDTAPADRMFLMYIGSNPGRFYSAGGYPNDMMVATRWWKGKWYYDTNSGFVPFTTNASDFIVGSIRRSSSTTVGITSYWDLHQNGHEILRDGTSFYKGLGMYADDAAADDANVPGMPGAVSATAEATGIRFSFGGATDTGTTYKYKGTTNFIADNYVTSKLTDINGFPVSAGTSNLAFTKNYGFDGALNGGVGIRTVSGTNSTIRSTTGTSSYTYVPEGTWYSDEFLTGMHGDAPPRSCHIMFAPDGDLVSRMPMATPSENKNFRLVCLINTGWRFDDNSGGLRTFTRKANDVLVAEVFRNSQASTGIDSITMIDSADTDYTYSPQVVSTDPRSWTPELSVVVPASGVNGYSYTFSTTGLLTPNTTSNGTATSYLVPYPSGGLQPTQYFAVKARDARGNWSAQRNFTLSAPQVSAIAWTTALTNQNVNVTANAISGTYPITSITRNGVALPTIEGKQTDVITANGTYVYEVTDSNGFTWSDTVTINNIDKAAPTGNLTASTTAPTNGDVTLTVSGAADTGVSGLAGIALPNGTMVAGSTATYTVTANGTYTFRIIDNAGNETDKTIVVDNIDKSAPTGTLSASPTTPTNGDVTLNLVGVSDSGTSGLKNIKLPDGTFVTGSSASYDVTANGTYSFTMYDNAGNSRVNSISVTNIDKNSPTGNLAQDTTAWTNGGVLLTLSAVADTGGSGLKNIKAPDGTLTFGTTASQLVSTNGTYSFVISDNAGNTTTKSITVTNIDKLAPTGTLTQTPTAPTNGSVTLNLTAVADTGGSGVKSITLETGHVVTGTSAMMTVSSNGTFSFEIEDNAGNSTTKSITVSNIDKTVPTGTLSQTPTAWTNGNVTLNLTAIADTGGSGYYRTKLPNGTFVSTTTASQVVTANGTYSFEIFDNAGNSTVKTISVTNMDKLAPTGNLAQTPTAPTNGNVTLNLTGVADTGGSGLKNITLPNGTVMTGTTASQVVSANGTYSFEIEDNAGNSTTKTIVVSNIDGIDPTGTLTQTPTAWTNGNVTLNLTAVADTGGSGLKNIVLPNGTVVPGTSASQVVSANGTYTFKIVDNAGNATDKVITVTNIEKSAPTANVSASTTAWTNQNVTLTLSAVADTGGSGLKSLTLPNGTVVAPVSATSYTHVVSANGAYSFELEDNAGNSTTKTISVTNIDKTAPAGTATASTTAPTNDDVTLTLSGVADSGGSVLKQLTLPNGTVIAPVSATSYTHVVSANGTYSFTLLDNAGNTTTRTLTVNNIDKVAPTGNLTASTTAWTNQNVTLTLSSVADSGTSGLKNIKLPNGTFVTGTSATYVVSANGTFTFEIFDNAGNSTVKTIAVSNIDKTVPTLTLVYNNSTNAITATVSDAGGSGLKDLTLPDGTKTTGSTATYTPQTFGDYVFTVTDNAGNTVTKNIVVDRLITIPDAGLRQAIIEKISQQFSIAATVNDIKEYRLSQLTGTFTANSRNILNLEGMQYLTNVTDVSLNGNPLTDVTPLQDLSNMNGLSLRNSGVTNVAPLNGLTNLNALNLGYTGISNLTGVGGMTNLSSLNIEGTQVADLTPISTLKNLVSFNGDNALLTSIAPLQANTKMQLLKVEGNKLANLNGISGMTQLGELYANRNLLTSMTAIKTATSLTKVDLSENKLSSIADLSTLVNVAHLDISTNLVSDISGMNNMSKLAVLYMDGNRVVSIEPLRNKTLLKEFTANDNRIWDLSPLSNKVGMTKFVISNNLVGKLPANLTGFPDASYYNNFITGKASQNQLSVIADKTMEEEALQSVSVAYTTISSTWTAKVTPKVTFTGNSGLTAEVVKWNSFNLRSGSDIGTGVATFELNPDVKTSFNVNVMPVMPAVIVAPATSVPWTNGSVTLNVSASTRVTDIQRIFLPNGTSVLGSSTQYVVSENGIYGFAVLDGYGRMNYTYYIVNNIDKKAPSVTVAVPSAWTKTDATIQVDVIND